MDESEQLLTARQRAFLEQNPGSELVVPRQPKAIQRPGPYGVGGWLAFLAISLGFLGPLITVLRTAADLGLAKAAQPGIENSAEWKQALFATWTVASLFCFLSIFASYRLFKFHVPNTIPIVIACIWVSGPLINISLNVLYGIDSSAVTEIVRSIIFSGVWTAYLLRSERVKNTYFHTKPDEDLFETFR